VGNVRRFAVFCCKEWDRAGGWEDYLASYASLNNALDDVTKYIPHIFMIQIVDLEIGKIVWKSVGSRVVQSDLLIAPSVDLDSYGENPARQAISSYLRRRDQSGK
jgi:hypothetical protein